MKKTNENGRRDFVQQWTQDCIKKMQGDGSAGRTKEGEPLTQSVGNFKRAKVIEGDSLYIVFVSESGVHLVGRMKVRSITERAEWDGDHPDNQLWHGPLVAEGQEGTPMVFWRPITAPILRCMVRADLINDDGTLTG